MLFFVRVSVAWCSQLEYVHVGWSVVTVQFYVSDDSLSIIVNTTSLSERVAVFENSIISYIATA